MKIARTGYALGVALLTTCSVLAAEGGGVTEIGKPYGSSAVSDSPAPFNALEVNVSSGEDRQKGLLNEEISHLFPQYPQRLTAPDSGSAYTNSRGVFWAEAIRRNGSAPDDATRDGVVADAVWTQVFRKDRDSAWMTFTVTKARLYVTRGPAYLTASGEGSRALIETVGVLTSAESQFADVLIDQTKALIASAGPWRVLDKANYTPNKLNFRYTIDSDDVKELTADRLVGRIDLSQLQVGETFTVTFRGTTSADTSLIEGPTLVEANFRDPLDSGASGIVIETDGLAALDQPAIRPPPADRARALIFRPDGKIVAAGYAYDPATANYDFALARYGADGALDPSFGSDGMSTTDFGHGADVAQGLISQSDGKLVVVGHASNGATDDLALARYDADGHPDTSFGTGGKVLLDLAGGSDNAAAVAVQTDGKIVVAGHTGAGSARDFAVVRFTAQGALDDTFGGGDGWTVIDFSGHADVAHAINLQSDGRIVVTGSADTGSSRFTDFAVARLNADGTLDSTFGTAGLATLDFDAGSDSANAAAILADGAIVVSGTATRAGNSDIGIAKFDANGQLDASFGSTGTNTVGIGSAQEFGNALALLPDGSAVVAGSTSGGTNGDAVVVHFRADGTYDTAFGSGGSSLIDFAGGSDSAAALARQADGKLLVAGYAVTATGDDFALARLTAP